MSDSFFIFFKNVIDPFSDIVDPGVVFVLCLIFLWLIKTTKNIIKEPNKYLVLKKKLKLSKDIISLSLDYYTNIIKHLMLSIIVSGAILHICKYILGVSRPKYFFFQGYERNNFFNFEHKELQKDHLKSELEILLEESSGNIDEDFQRMVSNCKPIDYNVIDKFTEKLPLISSIEERSKFELLGDHISNETIPSSIYTTAPISYISTSFPARDNQVFIHMSTFNPIYNYHPILFNGNPYTLREMKRLGFKSFDWLFDEKYDEVPSERERLIYSLVEFEKISKLFNNQILDLIYNNQDKLIFNRELMLSFKSYHRFFDKMNNHLKKYYGDK